MIIESMPMKDGFFMPAEYEKHEGTIMAFPYRSGSWPYGAKAARKAFCEIILKIAECERVYVAYEDSTEEAAFSALSGKENVELIKIKTDDAWARDIGPTFVINKEGVVRGINWRFNAWGGDFDGLYKDYENDDAFAVKFLNKTGYDYYDAGDFVLEGGSIHSNGAGTVLVTETCLLSKGRNPKLSKLQIEEKLKEYLGAKKIVWLPKGIYNDETNEHVDNVCAFISENEVVLAWTDDENDPQYEMSQSGLKVLENEGIKVHKLPIPKHPITVKEEDLKGYVFEEGEDVREVGERLAASYVNFYFCNDYVLIPQFGGENEDSDKEAVRIMVSLCKDRKVVPVSARDILLGGGNIHCITQQIPKGEKR